MKFKHEHTGVHVESRWHFGIPILDTDIPNFIEHQQVLINTFQKLRSDDSPAMVRSNQGGWHSFDNLHVSNDPNIYWLTQEILRIGTHRIMRLEGEGFKGKISMTSLWVNINGPGNWNMPHSHLPNEWSGVAPHNDSADRISVAFNFKIV